MYCAYILDEAKIHYKAQEKKIKVETCSYLTQSRLGA